MHTDTSPREPRFPRWIRRVGLLFVVLLVYLLSSGPVMATAFWLREQTGHDAFYAVMLLYYPLGWLGPDSIFHHYIEWWCWLFDTVGPG